MKLLAIVEFDHDGLHRMGDTLEVSDQFGKQLIDKGLCVEYSDKKAKELAKKKTQHWAQPVIEPATQNEDPNNQEQSPPVGDTENQTKG